MKKQFLQIAGLFILGALTIILCRTLDRGILQSWLFGQPDGPAAEAFSALTDELGEGGVGRAVSIFAEELTRYAAP